MSDQAVKFQRGKRIDRTLPRTLAPRRPRAGGGPRSLGAIGREGLKALLLERVHQGAHEILAAAGISVEAVGKALGREELRERLRGCHLLGIRSKTQLNAELLAGAEDLLAVGCFCIGTNQVDVDAAGQLGIPVFNAPHSNTRSVAEMIVAELILLSRRLGDRSGEVHGGRWRKVSTGCFEVRGKTLGIVGYGNIGSQVGILGEALGMRILYHDIVSKLSIGVW